MRNAKIELDNILQENNLTYEDIDYYKLIYVKTFSSEKPKEIKINDLNYDDGYGGQELHGIIVFKNGTWLERGEYDGAEWWEYKKTPTKEFVLNLKAN